MCSATRPAHDVHSAAEELLKIALQGRLLEQPPLWVQLNEQVQIAVRLRVSTRDGPEHAHRARAVESRYALDLPAAAAQPLKAWRGSGRMWVGLGSAPALELEPELAELVQRRIPSVASITHAHESRRSISACGRSARLLAEAGQLKRLPARRLEAIC
ncbi:MAG: hypothetical protein WBP81_01360 [Solirubrobacteraceae bacterium]